MHDKQSNKYDICVESKITKKTCYSIEYEIEPLRLIHTNLDVLK